MNEVYLEIVELDNGEIVLRPVNADDEEPLAVLKISEATKEYLQDKYFELAKHMFTAGIDFVYSDDFIGDDIFETHDDVDRVSKIIH